MRRRPEDHKPTKGPDMWKPSNCCPECKADQTVFLHWEDCQSKDWSSPDPVIVCFRGVES